MIRETILGVLVVMMTACGGKADNVKDQVSDKDKTAVTYGELQERNNCFIVVDKPAQELRVYETHGNDTVLLAQYPVCVGKNYGQKTRVGDMKTPECTFANPFTIKQIQDASNWYYDFHDGRGSILAYGNWFMRLETGFDGIGIHGSTNNENTVPGRGSTGCIRMRNEDLDELKENYAFVGMKVVILKDQDTE